MTSAGTPVFKAAALAAARQCGWADSDPDDTKTAHAILKTQINTSLLWRLPNLNGPHATNKPSQNVMESWHVSIRKSGPHMVFYLQHRMRCFGVIWIAVCPSALPCG
ncbi:MAG: hypothetical protein AAFN94_06540, partial [Pseudomonadota bacterium]